MESILNRHAMVPYFDKVQKSKFDIVRYKNTRLASKGI